MCKFFQIGTITDKNFHYIKDILKYYKKYSNFLHDDFTTNTGIEYLLNSIPYLWAVCDFKSQFMGFISLDNFTGNNSQIFSAEITTCFQPKAWGSFTKYCGKIFLKKCFDEFGFYKIKAQIFPDNYRIKTLLKSLGFEYEATMPEETIRNGRLQNIDIYSIKKSYYYKNEVNYYD